MRMFFMFVCCYKRIKCKFVFKTIGLIETRIQIDLRCYRFSCKWIQHEQHRIRIDLKQNVAKCETKQTDMMNIALFRLYLSIKFSPTKHYNRSLVIISQQKYIKITKFSRIERPFVNRVFFLFCSKNNERYFDNVWWF